MPQHSALEFRPLASFLASESVSFNALANHSHFDYHTAQMVVTPLLASLLPSQRIDRQPGRNGTLFSVWTRLRSRQVR